MFFLKYIFLTIFNILYKRAKKYSAFPEDSVKFKFGLILSSLLYLVTLIFYAILSKFLKLNLSISTNFILLLGTIFIILFGIYLSISLDFDSIKAIKLTRKQKNISRFILIFLITIILFY